ncbi:H/ACA RNA-protein complex component [Methanocaldococcus lauensis]|nr:H/ACA RNA-protein complex component [Methanocaldococcus lauensis]
MKIKILHKTPKGFLIGRGIRNIKINSVVTYKNKKIGKVIDIFGPITNPYIKIRPINKDIEVPEIVYIKNDKSKYKNHKKRKK